jgi:hypothetical protein
MTDRFKLLARRTANLDETMLVTGGVGWLEAGHER